MNFIEELKWRGLLQDATPGIEEFLLKNRTKGYLGVDPTSNSIHIGNLFPMMMLVHLQRAGHTPYALVGGATGMVGDPSGKDAERQFLSEDQIRYNVECIQKQLAHFLSFEGDNAAVMVNNYDWFKNMGFLQFLRDVGKHITVNYMLAKDSVKKRISGDSREGISYTEFAYQLLQGYDFLHLYKEHGVHLQVGGSDQWGNITTGTELIRRVLGNETDAFAATCPLLTRPDGTKFGKTAGGDSIWLDPEKTSPYTFYQFFLNLADDESAKLIKVYTLLGREEIDGIVSDHTTDPGKRGLQRALADNFTHRVHGHSGLDNAQTLTRFFFGSKTSREELAGIGESVWKSISQSAQDKKTLPSERLLSPVGLLDLLFESGITESKGDAKRAVVQDKSISLNGELVTDPAREITRDDFFHGRYMVVNRGKKNKFILELTA